MTTRADASNIEPRLFSKKDIAAYVGVTTPTFDKWVLAGVMPPAVGITRKWDRKAVDAMLDKLSGLETSHKDDGYETRKRERDAKKAAKNSNAHRT